MSLILALETTSEVCSVALGSPGDHVLINRVSGRQHSRQVLTMIDEACHSLDIKKKSIDCVAFSAGPGSFTGVRIGASIAQGVAFGTGAKISRISTSQAMAAQVARLLTHKTTFWTRRKSRADFVYDAKFDFDGSECNCVIDDRLTTTSAVDRKDEVFSDDVVALSALDVLCLAADQDAVWEEPINALPIYVEGDNPWRPQK